MTDTVVYFTGSPCVTCGGRLRYSSNRKCMICARSYARGRYRRLKEVPLPPRPAPWSFEAAYGRLPAWEREASEQ